MDSGGRLKLLLDENISRRVLPALLPAYPGSVQVADALLNAGDEIAARLADESCQPRRHPCPVTAEELAHLKGTLTATLPGPTSTVGCSPGARRQSRNRRPKP